MHGIHPLIVFSRTVTCRDFVKAFQFCYFTSFQTDIHTTHAKRMSHSQHKKKNGIPDRWTDYKSMGKRIPGTRFIAFKVPLKRSLLSRVSPSEAFGPNDLVHVLEEEKQQLGLIIDLTFTTRYYKPEDLPDSVYYVKIFTAGHEVPSDPTILSFKRAVRRFLRDNEENDKLIGVHCTHGLNRTGYLVCRYLIDVDGIEPEKAIELFNTSRGHSIERQNYIDDLQQGSKRSNDGMELEEPDQEPVQGYANQRHRNAPFAQTQVSKHHPPFRNQRPRSRDYDVPYEDSFRHPHDWGRNQGFNGGPGLLPPPPGFYPGPGLYPDPPPFMRLPHRHHPSDWDRRGPSYTPPYPVLPRYRLGGAQEGPPGAQHQPQGHQRKPRDRDRDRDRDRNRPHKHAQRDRWT